MMVCEYSHIGAPDAERAPDGSAESCTIVRLPLPRRIIEQHDATEITARLVLVAFSGPTENAVCVAASRALGVSQNTVRGLIRRETTRVDARILLQTAVYCMAIGKDPMAVAGVRDVYQKYCGASA